jgi:hypothetical protein
MKVLILQSNYIPWKGYFDAINDADVFIVYDEVQYTKNDWRNRNLIKAPDKLMWLTIPVRQHSLQQRIFETEISSNNWNVKHWLSLKSNYSKSQYFKEYEEVIYNIYNTIDSNLLAEVNLVFIRAICEILGITTKIIDSRSLDLKGDKNERLVDAILKVGGDKYLSGPAAKSYLNEDLFAENGITVEWLDYSGYLEYNQLFPPFNHSVSVLDLIFNTGPDASKYLKSFKS